MSTATRVYKRKSENIIDIKPVENTSTDNTEKIRRSRKTRLVGSIVPHVLDEKIFEKLTEKSTPVTPHESTGSIYERIYIHNFNSDAQMGYLRVHKKLIKSKLIAQKIYDESEDYKVKLKDLFTLLDEISDLTTSKNDRGVIAKSAHQLAKIDNPTSLLAVEKSSFHNVDCEELIYPIEAYLGFRTNRTTTSGIYKSSILSKYTGEYKSLLDEGARSFTHLQLLELLKWAFSGWEPGDRMISNWIGRRLRRSDVYTLEDFYSILKHVIHLRNRKRLINRLDTALLEFLMNQTSLSDE
jgi:hypothetical protein